MEAFPFFVWEAMKLKTSVSISIFFYWLYLIIEKDLYSFLLVFRVIRLWSFSPSNFKSIFPSFFIFLCTLFIVMCCTFFMNFLGLPLRLGRFDYYLFCSFSMQLYKPNLNRSPPSMLYAFLNFTIFSFLKHREHWQFPWQKGQNILSFITSFG